MAGNSKRTGAVRKKAGGNPTAGSGGRRKRGLEGKGPTPKAGARQGHKAFQSSKPATARPEARRSGGRTPSSADWVAGRNAVVEALQARVPVTSLYIAEHTDRDDRVREAFKLAAERNLSILEVSRTALDKMTDGAVHQGLAMKVPPYEYAGPHDLTERAANAGEPPLLVALDAVTDPRNLGAVVRSAAAFGVHGVVVPERRAAGMTASAWKTSAGAAARVPVARVTNLTRALETYKREGLMVAGLDAAGKVAIADLELAEGPVVLVVGSEGKGLSRLVRESCDVLVRVPMSTSSESLNAGVAAGIALYEIDRRRRSVTA
ncbi:MAG: 23S rRNA (guanosine(2251)-2'-O)-methyltransferase RlmB [Nocardioidaceae bacterium]